MDRILENLPERGYQDNDNVKKLLTFPEQKVDEWHSILTNLYKEVDADTCSDEFLDYLAFLYGFSDSYWSFLWSNEVKRNILKLGIKYWQILGTKEALELWLAALNIPCSIWSGSVLTLPFKMSAKLGTRRNKVVFRLPISETRSSYTWLEAVRMSNHHVSVSIPSRVGYETFRLGFSKLGEPMFSRRIFAQDITDGVNPVSTDGSDIVTT